MGLAFPVRFPKPISSQSGNLTGICSPLLAQVEHKEEKEAESAEDKDEGEDDPPQPEAERTQRGATQHFHFKDQGSRTKNQGSIPKDVRPSIFYLKDQGSRVKTQRDATKHFHKSSSFKRWAALVLEGI